MFFILIAVFFLINSFDILAQTDSLPFKAERMITDFRGVVSNGDNILCYGNYGIITFSKTSGRTWQQLNIGDKYNIKKIKAVGKDFFGITEYSIIKSDNNGFNWLNIDIAKSPEIIDFSISDNTIFILTAKGVISSDFNLNIDKHLLLELDDYSSYNEIESDNKNIYIISNNQELIRFNLTSKISDTINLVNKYNSDMKKAARLRISKGSVYSALEMTGVDNYKYSLLLKSTDYGENWKCISPIIYGTDCYGIIDDEIRLIKLKGMKNNILGIEYSKIDSTHFALDSSFFTIINKNDSINRFVYNKYIYGFNEIIRIAKDTLIAVGSNKLIAVSYNNGNSWELKSFFNCFSYYYSDQPFYFVNKDIIFCPAINKTFYKSMDGGVTWLPSLFNIPNPNNYLNGGGLQSYIYNDKGLGVNFYFYGKDNDSLKKANGNILRTKDFGETFSIDLDTIQPFPKSQQSTMRLGNEYLYYLVNSNSLNNYTEFYFIDSDFKIRDSVRNESISITNIVCSKDSILYSFGRILTDSTITDSTHFKYGNYFISKSIDKGRKWEIISLQIPFKYVYEWYKKSNKVTISDMIDFNIYDKYILIPFYYYDDTKYKCKFFRLNLESNKFDSLNYEPYFGEGTQTFFTFSNKLYAISSNDKFYYNNNFDGDFSDLSKWNYHNIKDLLYNWNNHEENKMISYWIDNDYGFMTSGKKVSPEYFLGPDYSINLIKIRSTDPTSVEDKELKLEINNKLLIYPNPAREYIEIMGSIGACSNGNEASQIASESIQIFDMLGVIAAQTSSSVINQSQTRASDPLRIDVTFLSPGLYFIKIGNRVEKFVKM
jgi:hypothetical protein